jgi:tetratricopeptide (TPR) repeat protein
LTGLSIYPKRHLRKLIRQGEYRQAIEFGHSIEGRFAGDADFNFIMGSIFYILEDAQKAMGYFDASLKIDDRDVETWLLKGNIHLFLKEKQDVLECCNRILDVEPDHAEAQALLEKLRDL